MKDVSGRISPLFSCGEANDPPPLPWTPRPGRGSPVSDVNPPPPVATPAPRSKDLPGLFRTEILRTKKAGPAPVQNIAGVSFMHMRYNDVYFVAVCNNNANAMLAFKFLRELIEVLRAYFGDRFSQGEVLENFVLIFELLDEVVDYGFPQVVDPDILKEYILQKSGLSKLVLTKRKEREQQEKAAHARLQVTGAVGYRREGIRYKVNELFMDIVESVNMLMNNKGQVLSAEVRGKIQVKCFLSGMPDILAGLGNTRLDDVKFHQCVNLARFHASGAKQEVAFTPPDGEFTLMTYRSSEGITPPFVVQTTLTEHGKSRVEVMVKIKADFDPKLAALNTVVTVPVPRYTSKVKCEAQVGKAKWDNGKDCITWKIKKFTGQQMYLLFADCALISTLGDKKPWARPPVSMEFNVPALSTLGMKLSYLKIWERSGIKPEKWVRKITESGDYQIRL